MLKGSKSSLNGDSKDPAGVIVDRPRKKLSFREPEIMGYYRQQMEQSEKKKNDKNFYSDRERERLMNMQFRISEEEEEDEEELEVKLF